MKGPNLEKLGREEPAEPIFIELLGLTAAVIMQHQNLGVSYTLGIYLRHVFFLYL